MVKRPTGSGGEPSSPNCGASAGVRLVTFLFCRRLALQMSATPHLEQRGDQSPKAQPTQLGFLLPSLDSVPLISRPMLSLCRQSSKPDITTMAMAMLGVACQATPLTSR